MLCSSKRESNGVPVKVKLFACRWRTFNARMDLRSKMLCSSEKGPGIVPAHGLAASGEHDPRSRKAGALGAPFQTQSILGHRPKNARGTESLNAAASQPFPDAFGRNKETL